MLKQSEFKLTRKSTVYLWLNNFCATLLFLQFLSLTQSIGPLGRGISQSQDR
jgi:hypothetical protein